MILRIFVFIAILLTGCVGIPDNIKPVKGFEIEKYLGTWHEIARLDHTFERGLTQVTADYSKRDDGSIKVINRGYDADSHEWKEAEGWGYFVEDANTAYLKVAFFRPFYGSYVVFDLGDDYQYSLITGADKSYFWILARTPTMDAHLKHDLVKKAQALGFDTSKLIYAK